MYRSGVKAVSDSDRAVDVEDDGSSLTHPADAESTSIPWTIANKYYTADVHFETREYKMFLSFHASEVPAVIYVWSRGDVRPSSASHVFFAAKRTIAAL